MVFQGRPSSRNSAYTFLRRLHYSYTGTVSRSMLSNSNGFMASFRSSRRERIASSQNTFNYRLGPQRGDSVADRFTPVRAGRNLPGTKKFRIPLSEFDSLYRLRRAGVVTGASINDLLHALSLSLPDRGRFTPGSIAFHVSCFASCYVSLNRGTYAAPLLLRPLLG